MFTLLILLPAITFGLQTDLLGNTDPRNITLKLFNDNDVAYTASAFFGSPVDESQFARPPLFILSTQSPMTWVNRWGCDSCLTQYYTPPYGVSRP